MKTRLLFLAVAVAFWAGSPATVAGTRRTQTLSIRAGWNAVYLEVQPEAATPEAIFGKLPVETVACFVPGRLEARFLRSPGDAPWREEGWAVWHAPARPDAFLSTLREVQARRGLLVLARADFTWEVTGEVRSPALEWSPNECTLTGLPVDPAAPPTFAQFFQGSPAHRRLRFFRLESGSWKLVRNPATDMVRSGEAYWIQTDGASRYQGPLNVRLPASGELDFDRQGGDRALEFINDAATGDARIRIEVVAGAEALPLRRVTRDRAKLETVRESLPPVLALPTLASGTASTVRLEPHREAMASSRADCLLKITDGRGTLVWVPVRAGRETTGPSPAQP